jgi:hypothetical protein
MVGLPMPKKTMEDKPAHLNLRNIPRNTLFKLKMAAAAEQRTLKDLVLELIEGKIADLEKKGLLPKSK